MCRAYFSRLGLWGIGNQTGFDSFKAFEQAMNKRGIGAFELLAMELKGTHTLMHTRTHIHMYGQHRDMRWGH